MRSGRASIAGDPNGRHTVDGDALTLRMPFGKVLPMPRKLLIYPAIDDARLQQIRAAGEQLEVVNAKTRTHELIDAQLAKHA